MTAVVLDSYDGIDGLRIEQRPMPKPGRDEVLVKVAASPINPSDLAFLVGRYASRKPLPVIPGVEGSGTVVAAGPGVMGRYFLGKRVACFGPENGDGVWAEYVVTGTKGGVLPLHESVSLEQGSMSAVNPLTAVAFLELVRTGRHKAIVQTAAASALGQMVDRLARREGVHVINIVRRDAQVEFLKGRGATTVLNSDGADFDQQLREACRRHGARLAFDAVAGSLTQQLLGALAAGGRVTVYGGLSREPAQASPEQLIFGDKIVDGFWLVTWLARKNPLQILRLWRRAQKLLSAELNTTIRVRYPFRDVKQAIGEYLDRMTGGKVLLVPGPEIESP